MKKIVLALVTIFSVFFIWSCGEKSEKPGLMNYMNNQAEDDEEKLDLHDVRSWVTSDVWNNYCDLDAYINSGTDCCGREYDAEFGYKQYLKALDKREEYTEYIHKKHPDIIEAWDKMMEQVDIINANLEDGFETGSERLPIDLFQQYRDAFYDYCNEVDD